MFSIDILQKLIRCFINSFDFFFFFVLLKTINQYFLTRRVHVHVSVHVYDAVIIKYHVVAWRPITQCLTA